MEEGTEVEKTNGEEGTEEQVTEEGESKNWEPEKRELKKRDPKTQLIFAMLSSLNVFLYLRSSFSLPNQTDILGRLS